MATKIERRYHFEAGHFLPHVRDGHKCKNQHGHNYEFVVTIKGEVSSTATTQGFVIDFWDLDAVVNPIMRQLDHKNLNDVPGLENPTAEHIAHWLRNRIFLELYGSLNYSLELVDVTVTVYETKDCAATAYGTQRIDL